MKIVLIDGTMKNFLVEDSEVLKYNLKYKVGVSDTLNVVWIDAGMGHSCVVDKFNNLNKDKVEAIVTNDIILWGNQDYSWNEELDCSDAYIYLQQYATIENVQNLTSKEIRKAHNLEKMYLAGLFDEYKPNEFQGILSALHMFFTLKRTSGLISTDRYVTNLTELANFLITAGVRYVDVAGMVSCKGEVYMCPPELEDKVCRLLNTGE